MPLYISSLCCKKSHYRMKYPAALLNTIVLQCNVPYSLQLNRPLLQRNETIALDCLTEHNMLVKTHTHTHTHLQSTFACYKLPPTSRMISYPTALHKQCNLILMYLIPKQGDHTPTLKHPTFPYPYALVSAAGGQEGTRG